MSANFELAIKSTLDYLVMQAHAALLSSFPGLQAAEIDDVTDTDKVFASADPALFWQWRGLTPENGETLYKGSFLVGAKTVSDKGNYQLIDLLSQVLDLFRSGDSVQLRNYSSAVPPYELVGSMFIMAKEVDPQQFDKQAGLRYARVSVRIAKWPT